MLNCIAISPYPICASWGVQRIDQDTGGSTTRVSQLVVKNEDLPQSSHGKDTSEANEQHEADRSACLV